MSTECMKDIHRMPLQRKCEIEKKKRTPDKYEKHELRRQAAIGNER